MIEPVLAKRIRLVGLDVDGTMTDGGLYIGGPDGKPVELKRFDIQDGMGMKLLQRAGIKLALITGRAGDAAQRRAEELEVDEFIISGKHKLPAFETMLAKHGVTWEQTAFVGDDLIDIPLLHRAALPVAVAYAVPEVQDPCLLTHERRGGHGAVREFVELLLKARGEWGNVVKTSLRERGDEGAA